jgi:hypothetical protein
MTPLYRCIVQGMAEAMPWGFLYLFYSVRRLLSQPARPGRVPLSKTAPRARIYLIPLLHLHRSPHSRASELTAHLYYTNLRIGPSP